MRLTRREFATLTSSFVVAALAGGCGKPSTVATPAAGAAVTAAAQSDVTLTFYNAQHENLVKVMVDGFTRETGIKVEIRSGKDFELANQIVQEGAGSPADAFITENSPAMQVVAAKGCSRRWIRRRWPRCRPLRAATATGWASRRAHRAGLQHAAARPAALPASIMDLARPEWKGKVGIAAAGADFQAIVSAVLALKGEATRRSGCKGLKTNARVYSGNGAVMRAVNAGEIPAGVIYHYYWYKDRAESGANSANTELHFFGNQDPGGFVSVSGLGALKSSKHPEEAQQLLQYLTGQRASRFSPTARRWSTRSATAPRANPNLKPLSELSLPEVDIATLNGPR